MSVDINFAVTANTNTVTLTWNSVALGVATNTLATFTNIVGLAPPVGAHIINPTVDVNWTSGPNASVVVSFPLNSVQVASGATTVGNLVALFPPIGSFSVPLNPDGSITVTVNGSFSGNASFIDIPSGNGIPIFINGLRTTTIHSLVPTGNSFTYFFGPNNIAVIFSFGTTLIPLETTMYITVVSPLIGAPVTTAVQTWGVLSLPLLLDLLVSSMTITYTPTSLTGVNMHITINNNGAEWTWVLPIISGTNFVSPAFNEDINFTLPGSRTINTYFYIGDLLSDADVESPTTSLLVESGDTSIPAPSIPSVVSITIAPFCIHPDSMIHTTEGLKRLGDLRGSQNVQLIDFEGKSVKMLFNAEFVGSAEFVRYDKGSIGPNMPSQDLYMTEGHPILYNGRERVSKYMINDEDIQLVYSPVDFTYAPVTEKRTFIMINNAPVCSWALSDLTTFAKKSGTYYKLI
jgi:hypothetical protein